MRQMNVADLVAEAASRRPDAPALRWGVTAPTDTITWRDFDAATDRIAAGLVRLGIERGDRVAIAAGNVPGFAFAYFGILRAGAIAVPLNAMLTREEIGDVIADSGAKVVIGAPPVIDVAAAAPSAAGIRVHASDDPDVFGSSEPVAAARMEADDIAVLAYTSGTTGRPKGAMLSHGNLLANLEQQMSIPEAHVTPDDVLLLALPLFHIFGLNVTLGLLALNAATGILIERFEPIATLRAIQEERVSVIFGAPPMYVAWVSTPGADQYDLSGVRLAISGAAPLSEETLRSFKDIFGVDIYEGYGLTETAPSLTSNRMAEQPRARSIGKPLPGVELRIVDPEGKDVELGDPGEIVVRGPNVFKGYWDQPELNQEAFIDGWFRTGDVAVRDEDGYIFLVDRKRDLIIVSGFNVFPSEVEAALLTHPKIGEAAVIGVPHPYTGEAVKAFVVLADGADASETELLEEAAPRLARFKRPESIEIVEHLPHLPTGKVSKRELSTEAHAP